MGNVSSEISSFTFDNSGVFSGSNVENVCLINNLDDVKSNP